MPMPRSLTRSEHRDLDLTLTRGVWPEGLGGEMWMSAPAGASGLAYALFAPGTLIRLSLEAGRHGAAADRFAWRAGRVRNPSVRLLEERSELLSSQGPAPGVVSPLGFHSMANTAPLPWGDRIFTTWDVGRPCELDPLSLAFLGEVGSRRSWGPSMPVPGILPFIFSTAHPVIDPDRDCLWTVKLAPSGVGLGLQPSVVRWEGEGPEVGVWPVEGASFNGTMHTISQTTDWLVLIDSGNFKADPGEMAGGPRTVLMDPASPVFLVRKADVETTPSGQPVPMQRFEIAPPTGHFYALQTGGDRLRVIFEHMDGMDLGFFLRPDDLDAHGLPIDPSQVGLYNMAMCPSTVSEVEFDVESGKTIDCARFSEPWAWNLQLSAMDWSPAALAAQELHHVVYQGRRPHNVSRRALRSYDGRFGDELGPETRGILASFERGGLVLRSRYDYPDEALPTSPTFVPRGPLAGAYGLAGPRPGGADGWVVVPALSDAGLRVDVFEAADVGAGPVATLSAPDGATVPLLLHAAWSPRAVQAPAVERLRFVDDFEPAEVQALEEPLRAAVARVVQDLKREH
jgi:hypothetical protein